jgi:hypothetical protein
MAIEVTLLPSPLLPATAYARLGEALRSAGTETFTADPRLMDGQNADDLVRRWSDPAQTESILVAHSNAGMLAPGVRALTDPARRIVFMDAALLPEAGDSPLAPQRFLDMVAGLADDHGLLPPWTRWWPRADLAKVLPDDLFDAIDRECPRPPVTYFDHRIHAPDEWAASANGYLAFGDTYATELRFAVEHSWPHRRIAGGHLHFLHHPETVADLILDLAARLG